MIERGRMRRSKKAAPVVSRPFRHISMQPLGYSPGRRSRQSCSDHIQNGFIVNWRK